MSMKTKPYSILIATVFTILLLLFLHSIAEILLLLFIAILFSVYLSAITDALQRRLGAPRVVGLLLGLLVTGFGVFGIGYLIVPPVLAQTQSILQTMPRLMQGWESSLIEFSRDQPFIGQMLGDLQPGESYVANIAGEVSGYFRDLVPYIFSGVGFLIELVSVLVMGIYFALRPGVYREGFIVLFPPIHRDLVRDIMADLSRTLRAWIVGQMLAMVVLGALTWLGLVLLQVPYALAFGVFTGAVAIVPFFGTLVSTIIPALFVLGETGAMGHALLVALLGVVVHVIEANLIAPMIMERQVHLPPVLSILSVLIMAHLLHLIGLLVAVPVLCVVMVLARRVYVHRVLEGKGFRRAIRDRPIEIRLPGEGAVLVHPGGLERSVPAMLEG